MPKKKEQVIMPVVHEQTKAKRVFRTAEERFAEIDKKIAFHQRLIELLETKKSSIGTGHRQRKPSFAKVFAELKASGKTPEEILELFKK